MGNYTQITHWLRQHPHSRIEMSFRDVEGVLGRPLPASAYKYRAWWSNNPDNNVMTRAWLAAGFETAEVDMAGQRLVFQKPRPATPSYTMEKAPERQQLGVAEMSVPFDWSGSLPLSPKAQAWVDASGSRADAIARAVEAAAAREARMGVVARYAALKLSGGADSVDLVREDRDGR